MLETIRIAKPCGADWKAMTGDDRVRFCQLCKLNVYDLSAMKREDAEALIAEKEGKLCARLFQRADGTVITQDCPVGLAAVRHRIAKVVASIAALFVVAWSALARTGDQVEGPNVEPTARDRKHIVMGEIECVPDREVMGKVQAR